jgi:DNA-binding NtrC family response regulator
MKILVVHQERAVADTLAESLRNQGHRVLPLYCPFDALNHFLEVIQFDVALISICLVGLTGEELADVFRIKVFQPNCRVILFGFEDVVESMKARRPEFEYLEMPFENEALLSVVENCRASSFSAIPCSN